MLNDLLIETNMHYESSDNDRRQTRQNIKDLTYGRSKSGACRGVPVGRGRRGTEEPPDPSATREMSRINMFVRRGVEHDTAGGGNRSHQSSPLLQEPGKSFTSGAQRGASQGQVRLQEGKIRTDGDQTGVI